MPEGKGIYDAEATALRESTDASIAAVIVLHGNRGSGFSVQTYGADATFAMPALLRSMADSIEADAVKAGKLH
jgi:hypothetical protein